MWAWQYLQRQKYFFIALKALPTAGWQLHKRYHSLPEYEEFPDSTLSFYDRLFCDFYFVIDFGVFRAAAELNALILFPDWCDLMCDFKFPIRPKVAGHRLHFKCLILMWTTLTCSWRYGPRLNFLWQCGHSNFLIFLWIVSICRFWKENVVLVLQ